MQKTAVITLLRFEVDFQTVGFTKYVDSNANSMTFINYGTAPVQIENVILQQNQQLAIEGNEGEYTSQRFLVNFNVPPSGSSTNVVVIRKRYINVEN